MSALSAHVSAPGAWIPPMRQPASVPTSPLRFQTVQALYEAFPTAAGDVGAEPEGRTSLSFLESCIADQEWSQGLSFAAYLLPRRQAVWWGAQSLRRVMRDVPGIEALAAAEAWVRRPEEAERCEAMRIGNEGDGKLASTWIALAAGWSGGSIVPAELGRVPAPPSQAPKAVRAALLILLSRMPAELQPRLVRPCLDHAIALACGLPDEN